MRACRVRAYGRASVLCVRACCVCERAVHEACGVSVRVVCASERARGGDGEDGGVGGGGGKGVVAARALVASMEAASPATTWAVRVAAASMAAVA